MLNLDIPDRFKNAMEDSEFRIYCKKSDDESAEVLIMDQIGEDIFGDGVKATDVVAFLAEQKGTPINVRINSPGGLVYDGLVIYNALANHDAKVTVTIEGLAYSAASFIAMAGDKIRMHEASDIGIHRAWGVAMGNSKAMKGTAEWLDKLDQHLVEIYQSRSGASVEQINEWMDGTDDGTLFSAKEAVEIGFADEWIPSKKKKPKSQQQVAAKAMNRMRAERSSRIAKLRRRTS